MNQNGNDVGSHTLSVYAHNGSTRKDASGRPYLGRNFTVKVTSKPTTPVSIRLYVRKAAFDALKNTPGSEVTTPSDLAIFMNADSCSNCIVRSATKIAVQELAIGETIMLLQVVVC